ncbi:MAG: site-specific integrase [Acidimicrobiales bacterium]
MGGCLPPHTPGCRSPARSRTSAPDPSSSASRPAPATSTGGQSASSASGVERPDGSHDWMFCNSAGRCLNPESVSQLFDRIVRRNDVPRIRFHDARHTHASLLVAAGVPLKVVSERLGHAHPAFTMHTYPHLLPGIAPPRRLQVATLVGASSRQTSTGRATATCLVRGGQDDDR